MADFVVVGGGVYGCGVAWQLAQRGAEVILLEARQIASGASGGPGKRGVRANGRDLRELPLMALAYERWPTLHERLEAETGYEQIGHLLLVERERDRQRLAAQAWMQTQQGIPTHLLTAAAVKAIEPEVSDRIIAALHCPLDGVADHTATTQAYAAAARRLGVEIREETAVIGWERSGERITAVITNKETAVPVGKELVLLSNQHVVDMVAAELGVTLPIWWVLPQVVLTEPVSPMPVRHLIGHAHRLLAMKSLPSNQVMISGGWRGRWHPDRQQGESVSEQVAGNVAEAVAIYPTLADVAVHGSAADRIETMSIDGIPIIDRLPGVANLLVATGWCGHGWAIAPAVVQLLAEWAYTGQRPELLRPFAYGRFLRE